MPFYQNQFDFLQKAYQEPLSAIAALGGSAPYKLFGITETAPASDIYTDGAICYGGEIIPFTGGAVGLKIVINTYTTSLLFADGVSKQVQTRKVATFGTGAVEFLFADLKLFQEGFGAAARTGWVEMQNSAAGQLSYNYCKMTKTVSVRGWIKHVHTASTAAQTWASPSSSVLPVEMRPSHLVVDAWGLQFATSLQKSGGGYIDVIQDINGMTYDAGIVIVQANGVIGLVARRLAVGVTLPIHIINFSFTV